MASVHQVEQAIRAASSQQLEQQRAANQWLNEFALTDAAWAVSVDLLDKSKPVEVQFYSANILLNKVHRQWPQLAAENRQQLAQAVRYTAGGQLCRHGNLRAGRCIGPQCLGTCAGTFQYA